LRATRTMSSIVASAGPSRSFSASRTS
jgi:hypothetical protein